MDYVFALADGVSTAPGGAMVTTARGQVWAADDPFVQQRPDIFSATPPLVYNTIGSRQLDAQPLKAARPAPKKATKR